MNFSDMAEIQLSCIAQLEQKHVSAVYVCAVVVAFEGAGLADMANGLVNRYQLASQPPPVLLYVDRDCCSAATRRLFQPWQDLQI